MVPQHFADQEAERNVIGSIMLDPDHAAVLLQDLTAEDFYYSKHADIFAVMQVLWDGDQPLDPYSISSELKQRGVDAPLHELSAMLESVPSGWHGRDRADKVKRAAFVRRISQFASAFADMAQDSAQTVDALYDFAETELKRISPETTDGALMEFGESFQTYSDILADRAALAGQESPWSWPWATWNRIIGNLEAGLVTMLAGGDGMGKTTFLERIAEHWAQKGNQIVFVHFELNRRVVLDRRMARHSGIPMRTLQSGQLSKTEQAEKDTADNLMQSWLGNIHYLYCPGWNMRQVVRELDALVKAGKCDGVIVDYLDKAAGSSQQIKLFGSNAYMRQADDVETLKNFAEKSDVRMVTATQLNKEGKTGTAKSLNRSDMRGAGEKSEKSNVVVLLHRKRLDDGMKAPNGGYIVEPGGYSPTVDVRIDKNTLGPTGDFKQIMKPSRFNVEDLQNG